MAGISFGLMGFNSNKANKGGSGDSSDRTLVVTDLDDDEGNAAAAAGDFITAQEVTKVFDRLFMDMQNVLSQLMQQIQQIQMSGQSIPEAQLKQLLRQEMERALAVKQDQILEEFDMDLDCLEEATWEFMEKEKEFPTVTKAVDRFQKLWEGATGEPVTGWRPGKEANSAPVGELLSAEKTIEVAAKYFDSLTENMRVLVEKFKAEGKELREPAVQQQLNTDFAQTANDAGEAALEVLGVTMKQFETSVSNHADNPTVSRALGMLQVKQQKELMALGQGTL